MDLWFRGSGAGDHRPRGWSSFGSSLYSRCANSASLLTQMAGQLAAPTANVFLMNSPRRPNSQEKIESLRYNSLRYVPPEELRPDEGSRSIPESLRSHLIQLLKQLLLPRWKCRLDVGSFCPESFTAALTRFAPIKGNQLIIHESRWPHAMICSYLSIVSE